MTTEFRYQQSDIAQRFDLGRQLPHATAVALADLFKRHAPRHVHRVVDLGCGTGRFSRLLADKFGVPVVGIELAGNMLAEAVAKHVGSSIRFVRGSATAIPVGAGAFDVVFISQVLHHLPDLPAAMLEIRRVLAAGGVLFMRQTTLENLDSYFYQRFFPEARLIDERRLPSREQISGAARSAGLSAIELPQTVRAEVAASSHEYVQKVATRTYSDLAMISDESFALGMKQLAQYMDSQPDQTWAEEVDHLICKAD